MKTKLYILANNVKIYDYYSYRSNTAITLTANPLPFLFYPNFKPCFEANAYMSYLYKKNLSNLNGGTIKTYGTYISHLIKYIYEQKPIIKFTDLNDNHIYSFIEKLKQRKISHNYIISIFRQCIDFLFFISDIYNKNDLIGVGNKFKIKVLHSKSKPKTQTYQYKDSSSYTHLALPKPNVTPLIKPVTFNQIRKIRNFVISQYDSDLKFRNLCLLDLLEFTGARRTEVLMLTVQDIKKSNINESKNVLPLLQLNTLKKRKNNAIRLVPIPQNLLNNLLKYIRNYRNPLLKKFNLEDHGKLFISHRSGLPLSYDTLTTYLNNWSKEANIEPPIHAHQFRHRFITEKFKALIQQHNINNSDLFSKLLISHERLKLEVLQWTGHTSIESLNPYIHLAITELTNIEESKKTVELQSTTDYYKIMVDNLISELEHGNMSKDLFINKIKNL
ncbi:tyrosine-type recombinase/integrase [Acinetobacter variabilis]|uniref:tyrosine-type recombinase/integrase n=1 Tax=Acinetobacter variabilis TaxID=70346 RepID=UPI00289FAF15|nr:tyrosine-type recombinase/integrase [Acinetobacter variabilis]